MGSAAIEEKLVDGLKRHPLDPTQFDAELDLAERSEGLARVYGERVLQRPDSSADLSVGKESGWKKFLCRAFQDG